MSLYRKFEVGQSKIGVWRIEEGIDFFKEAFPVYPAIKNENKRLQWMASRYLANNILNVRAAIVKDNEGKPLLQNSDWHISISHTPNFATVMVNPASQVGIDIELVNPKVQRIAHKFLREDEIETIEPDELTEKLILYWSAKEALYKLYGKGGIEFATQLLIEPFGLKQKGELQAKILTPEVQMKNLTLQYDFFEGHVLCYVNS